MRRQIGQEQTATQAAPQGTRATPAEQAPQAKAQPTLHESTHWQMTTVVICVLSCDVGCAFKYNEKASFLFGLYLLLWCS